MLNDPADDTGSIVSNAAAIPASDATPADNLPIRDVVGTRRIIARTRSLPLPPKYPSYRFRPMTWEEAYFIVNKFNAWVTAWNDCELHGSEINQTPWTLGSAHQSGGLPNSAILFALQRDQLPFRTDIDPGCDDGGDFWAAIRVEGWRMWDGDGLGGRKAFCRNRIDPRKIIWGGWALRRGAKKQASDVLAEETASDPCNVEPGIDWRDALSIEEPGPPPPSPQTEIKRGLRF